MAAMAEFSHHRILNSVLSLPLLRMLGECGSSPVPLIVDINLRFSRGHEAAQAQIIRLAAQAIEATGGAGQRVLTARTRASEQFVYARLTASAARLLAELDAAAAERAIHHIWPDFVVRSQLSESASTVKADACRRAFGTTGRGLVWAVLDSGIDAAHPHFAPRRNLLDLPPPLRHMDFTEDPPRSLQVEELCDPDGHGTHVAGIIAGESPGEPLALLEELDPHGRVLTSKRAVAPLSGIAPECKLISFRVLSGGGEGDPVSNVIAALTEIHRINSGGRHLLIHGVNLSLGYDFDPEWFACGQSPVCIEVNRLVRSGVVVVAAAGNSGLNAGISIHDPGNAELAITVGSTHRNMPHTYGVSYFSSKGPTGDGRRKPDLLAPGERIISCEAGSEFYTERSGTSMAAPHVSGIAAGILSARRELIGQPEKLKQLLCGTATCLGRETSFQGAGLVDMMRAFQSF